MGGEDRQCICAFLHLPQLPLPGLFPGLRADVRILPHAERKHRAWAKQGGIAAAVFHCIRTRAGAELARLHIIQVQGSSVLELQWTAGRAMCEDPAGEPCEWAGAAGESAHARQTQGGGLTAPLAVSADPDDPFTLHFARRPKAGQAAQGTLSSARGDIRWRVRIERDAQ